MIVYGFSLNYVLCARFWSARAWKGGENDTNKTSEPQAKTTCTPPGENLMCQGTATTYKPFDYPIEVPAHYECPNGKAVKWEHTNSASAFNSVLYTISCVPDGTDLWGGVTPASAEP